MNNETGKSPDGYKKVILVEDNMGEAELTKISYQDQSIPVEIIHCSNGEEFLNTLSNLDQSEISYVLLDLNMPRLNGYDVLNRLSLDNKWKNLIVIIFSSSNNANDVNRCYEMGAKAYVSKPFDLNELDRTIHTIHDFWGGVNIKPMMN